MKTSSIPSLPIIQPVLRALNLIARSPQGLNVVGLNALQELVRIFNGRERNFIASARKCELR